MLFQEAARCFLVDDVILGKQHTKQDLGGRRDKGSGDLQTSRDGRQLVYSRGRITGDIWVLDLGR